jgi:hypothetical protein
MENFADELFWNKGEWEHIIVSNVKRFIPESVKPTWTEWRRSMKEAEKDITGKNEVSDHAEMAGWGVEKASENNKRDASKLYVLFLSCDSG